MKITALFAVLFAASVPAIAQPQGAVLDPMDEATFKPGGDKAAVSVEEGHEGKALKLDFAEDAKSVFVQGRFRGAPAWDEAAGFSFWVKGDGSAHLGGIEMIWNEDYSRRYAFAFPISSTDWKKVWVRWSDLVPETSGPRAMIGTAEAPASKLGPISFGKWWYWADYAAHSYTIDDIRLEFAIPATPTALRPHGDPLSRVKAKIRAGQPITVVTMGDSLTDFKHWSNQQTNWPTMLGAKLKDKHGVTMTLINPALGGTELRQNVVLIPRWLAENAAPDLVTVFFGGNDWNSGMREPDFQSALIDAVRRIRSLTVGKSDVLLLSTAPWVANADVIGELAQATRDAAKAENAGLADTYAALRAAGGPELPELLAWDKVHLGKAGQEAVSDAVLKALEGGAG